MYSVAQYNPTYYTQWNEFVANSKNGTFLFHRDYMEYHSDRFTDFSLLVFEKNKVVAVLPANRVGDVVYSHQGLTYGGIVLMKNCGYEKVKYIYALLLKFLQENQIRLIYIKSIPSIYHKTPSFEIEILLNYSGARFEKRLMNLAIDYTKEYTISKSKIKHFKRLATSGFRIEADNNFDLFWDKVLIPRLKSRYDVKPVHTLEEIKLLHTRFPENIIQYNIYHENNIMAGITLFRTDNVVKSQYGATTETGEKLRALDYLFITLIKHFSDKKTAFDMGTVNDGESYNSGLLKQKEELGCSVFLHDFYSVATASYKLLDNVLI